MNISDWLDEKEAEGVDVSQIELPDVSNPATSNTQSGFIRTASQ